MMNIMKHKLKTAKSIPKMPNWSKVEFGNVTESTIKISQLHQKRKITETNLQIP